MCKLDLQIKLGYQFRLKRIKVSICQYQKHNCAYVSAQFNLQPKTCGKQKIFVCNKEKCSINTFYHSLNLKGQMTKVQLQNEVAVFLIWWILFHWHHILQEPTFTPKLACQKNNVPLTTLVQQQWMSNFQGNPITPELNLHAIKAIYSKTIFWFVTFNKFVKHSHCWHNSSTYSTNFSAWTFAE